MTRYLKRLQYRYVQRLNDEALRRRLERISGLREERIAEIRETERRYIGRFLAESPAPEAFAAEIDRDSSLAQVDRDLLVNEIFAVDVERRRALGRERPGKERAVGYLPPRPELFVAELLALPPAEFSALRDFLKDEHDRMLSERRADFDPFYASRRGSSDMMESFIDWYFRQGKPARFAEEDFLRKNPRNTPGQARHVYNTIVFREAEERRQE